MCLTVLKGGGGGGQRTVNLGCYITRERKRGCGGGEPCGRVGGGGQPLRRGRAIGHRGLRMIVERHFKCYADTEFFENTQDAWIFLLNL